MTYVFGAVAGLIFGGIVGYLKNHFIWKKYLSRNDSSSTPGEAGALYSRLLGSNIVNLIILLVAFLVRNIVPFDGMTFLIGTAVALASMNRVLSVGQKKRYSDERRIDG